MKLNRREIEEAMSILDDCLTSDHPEIAIYRYQLEQCLSCVASHADKCPQNCQGSGYVPIRDDNA